MTPHGAEGAIKNGTVELQFFGKTTSPLNVFISSTTESKTSGLFIMTSSKLGKGVETAPASSVHKMTTRSSKESNTSSQQPKDSKPTKTKAASEKEDEELKPEHINKDGRTYTPLMYPSIASSHSTQPH
jgi:hypothetical protein